MSRNAVYGQHKIVAAGHAAAIGGIDGTLGNAGPHVHTVGGIHAVQIALVHIIVAAGKGFLGRLEQKLHVAAKLAFDIFQQLGSAQQHGGVAVMPAGVHYAGVLAGIVHTAVFYGGQGVNVGAQQHGFAGLCALDMANTAVVIRKSSHGNAQLFQLGNQILCGFGFLKAQLGMAVQPVAMLGNLGLKGTGRLFEIHKTISCFVDDSAYTKERPGTPDRSFS